MDTYESAVAKVLQRTDYGTRQETPERSGWVVVWSNHSRTWNRTHEKVRRGHWVHLDANEIILYGPAGHVEDLARKLPVLPLDRHSFESRERGPEPPLSNPRPPSPEEEWMGEEESEEAHAWEDPTHSPYEGDVPPWSQSSYEGEFPMAERVFYVNAYTPLIHHQGLGIYAENLERFGMTHAVGTFPKELQFGADFDYVPFAAIPIRKEERDKKDFFFKYLERVAKRAELEFLRILIQTSFPMGRETYDERGRLLDVKGEVHFPDGKWFSFTTMRPFKHPRIYYVSAYIENRLYGGPEEGGWYYDAGFPVAAIPIVRNGDYTEDKMKEHLEMSIGHTSPHGLGSVLGHDVFGIKTTESFPTEYPAEPPHYE